MGERYQDTEIGGRAVGNRKPIVVPKLAAGDRTQTRYANFFGSIAKDNTREAYHWQKRFDKSLRHTEIRPWRAVAQWESVVAHATEGGGSTPSGSTEQSECRMLNVAAEGWHTFLFNIHSNRVDLKCSASSAWFRGHADHKWTLLPTIMREYITDDLHSTALYKGQLTDNEFEEIFLYLDISFNKRLRTTSDQSKEIRNILYRIKLSRSNLKSRAKDVDNLKSLSKAINIAKSGGVLHVAKWLKALPQLASQYKIPLIPLDTSTRSLGDALRNIDTTRIEDVQGQFDKERKVLSAEIDVFIRRLRSLIAQAYGERDAFIEFNFRLRENSDNGWHILAKMQHYGVPTRLLDWSENLSVALWFSLEKYFEEIAALRQRQPNILPDEIVTIIYERTIDLPKPSVWILNPYTLSQITTGENRIFDLFLGTGLDYYKTMFEVGWPYKHPIPIYSPWRNDERLSSQHAMFTVHGTDLRPLDTQLSSSILREVPIEHAAACFGAWQLSGLMPIDRYSFFRDVDNLGAMIKKRHIYRD